ncbi:DUF2971 domain-containing protein [Endozoicomonas gorgoniicola]|uniref:DUF2971 domain-containing protein n=1 Tax=Endozoicomonas gorgoniicola TaxID=1234144 RepID=A0ABT3MQJ4_9GAMM|nr:DUF2971 domain-containing protein [Endozoicomonas gorgoniicola]MCW7551645.1 DUF2971 domain-containing protein [Endozoicomonas gorgoniicola]
MKNKYMYRYKYLPFDEGSKCILTKGTIKFSNPTKFNDPFDCFPYYDIESINRLPETRKELVREASNQSGFSPAEHIKNKRKIINNIKSSFENKNFATSILDSVGVVSLTRTPVSILMWSHYADFHKGFVVEFKIPVMLPEREKYRMDRWLPCLKVKYSKNRPILKYGMDNHQQLLNKILLTKSRIWKYEKEERVIDTKNGPGIRTYLRDKLLCSVIAGAKMEQDDFKELSGSSPFHMDFSKSATGLAII